MLDPFVQTLFARIPQLANYPLWDKSPTEARAAFKALCQFSDPQAVAIGKTEDVKAPGPGGPLTLRVYTPVATGSAAVPAIVYYHGGGFVLGDLDSYDALCRSLANESGCRVISVDYRLAPEHPFPAAIDDAFAALKWIEENAPALAIDPNRVAVAGDSAGGNLAAAVSLLARDNKGSPAVAFQLLFYPATVLERRRLHPIAAGGFVLNQRNLDWFMDQYLPADSNLSDPRLSPLFARDLSGLPPAYIVTAGYDLLRDDGIAYAEKLKEAGVAVTHIDYPTMIHGFLSMQSLIPMAPQAIAAAGQAVKAALK